VQRDGTLSRNVSRDSFMVNDGLSRNVSNASLTEMVRNYSSASLEAVMEQSEAWPQDPSAYSDKQPTKVSLASLFPTALMSSCASPHPHPACALTPHIPHPTLSVICRRRLMFWGVNAGWRWWRRR
jgi:hypothetical protein